MRTRTSGDAGTPWYTKILVAVALSYYYLGASHLKLRMILASWDHLCNMTPMRTPRILPSVLTAAILWPCSRDFLYSYIIEPLDKSSPSDLVRIVKHLVWSGHQCIHDYENVSFGCAQSWWFQKWFEKWPEHGLIREEIFAQVLQHCLNHVLLHHLWIMIIITIIFTMIMIIISNTSIITTTSTSPQIWPPSLPTKPHLNLFLAPLQSPPRAQSISWKN